MSETPRVEIERSVFGEILHRFRQNIILIILIIALSICAGWGYTKLQKPIYTSSEETNYVAYYKNDPDDIQKSITIMRAYVHTMVDLCTTGVVLDKAEFYYNQFINSNMDFDEFINKTKAGEYESLYDAKNPAERKYFKADSVSATLKEYTEDFDSFHIIITCKNYSPTVVKQMVRVFAVAIDSIGKDFFTDITSRVYEMTTSVKYLSVRSDTSLTKNLLVFFGIGVILSALVVYIKTLLDNTITDKEDAELLTGINVLAYIDKQELSVDKNMSATTRQRESTGVENAN